MEVGRSPGNEAARRSVVACWGLGLSDKQFTCFAESVTDGCREVERTSARGVPSFPSLRTATRPDVVRRIRPRDDDLRVVEFVRLVRGSSYRVVGPAYTRGGVR